MMTIAASSKDIARSPQDKAGSQILIERAATANTLNDGRQPVLKVFETPNSYSI